MRATGAGNVPTSDWHRAAATGGHATFRAAPTADPAPRAKRQTLIFIVTSPRPQVGKTFIARVLIDFLRHDRDDPIVFDLNPAGDSLHEFLPQLAITADIGDVKGQMALFDRLIVDDGTAKVIDLG